MDAMLLYHVCFMFRRNFLESNVTNGLYEKNKQNSSFQFQPQAIVDKVSLQVCNAVTWEHQSEEISSHVTHFTGEP